MLNGMIDWSSFLKSGQRIFIGSNAGCPKPLINDFLHHSPGIYDIEVCTISTLGDAPWANAEHAAKCRINAFFIHGAQVRNAINEGRADYTPCFLSEISSLFSSDILPIDCALIMVTPPDELGNCSMGPTCDVSYRAAQHAKHIIAMINPSMPRTYGDNFFHISEFSATVEVDEPMYEVPIPEISKIYGRIGQYVSLLVDDGDTLQLGIGAIPNATLSYLKEHKNLGLHTEMMSDGVVELIEAGVINNRKKSIHPGKSIVSFCFGTERLYKFIHENPYVEFHPSDYVNRPNVIAKNDNMISINSALQVDLTGQVVSDSLGTKFYSGIGGQVDFVVGATMSKGGRSIIALPSTAKNGSVSRIVPFISEGSGVVTSRGHVDYIVTEFGVAKLKGKPIRERALELIRISHPDFRESLLEQIQKHFYVPDYQQKTPTEIPEYGDLQLRPLTLKDGGKYFLRALNPSDERRLQEFFYSHTKETIRLRYNQTIKQMSHEKSADLVSVNQAVDLALAIIRLEGEKRRIDAVGRFYRASEDTVELAFVTRESQQGKGMASVLMKEMVDIARQRGFAKAVGYIRAENAKMQAVFARFGFKRVYNPDPGEVEMVLNLKENA